MAAMRSALAMLGRRSCGSSGSSVAASMRGKGLDIHPSTPMLSVLRPSVRDLQSSRCFTADRKSVDKAEGGLRSWWQRRVKSTNVAEGAKTSYYYRLLGLGISMCAFWKLLKDGAIRGR